METIFMNTKNSKTNGPQKIVLNLMQRLDLRSLNKHVALQNLSIYYNNKLEIIPPTWNSEFELPDNYSVSYIQDYTEYIIKNMKHYPLILLFIFISTGLIED